MPKAITMTADPMMLQMVKASSPSPKIASEMNMSTMVVSPPTDVTIGPQTPRRIYTWTGQREACKHTISHLAHHKARVEHHAAHADSGDRCSGVHVRHKSELFDCKSIQDGDEQAQNDDSAEPNGSCQKIGE
jgi:hypothetical protein